jgi:hypothetical protein
MMEIIKIEKKKTCGHAGKTHVFAPTNKTFI